MDTTTFFDVVKAVATQMNETINYYTAWRALQGNISMLQKMDIQAFQLIIPYLERLKKDNPDATIVYEKTPNTERIKRFFVCPDFMNTTVQCHSCYII